MKCKECTYLKMNAKSSKDIKQITAKMKRGEPITGKELREFLERKGVRG